MTILNKVRLLPLYAIYLYVFILAAVSKWRGGVPSWYVKQFQNTLIDVFAGSLAFSFYLIALLETVTALLFLISLCKLEFLNPGRRFILLWALFLAQATFAILGFGLRLTDDFSGAYQLFGYFSFTFVINHFLMRETSRDLSIAASASTSERITSF